MFDYVQWPAKLLAPQSSPFDPVPFTRSGGRSLGGLSRSVKTDRGFWSGAYKNIVFRRSNQFAQRRTWNAIRTALNGMSGLVAVPVCASHVWASAEFQDFSQPEITHDDGTTFDDGAGYGQGLIDLQMANYAPLGASVVTLRLNAGPSISGVRFSYQMAMYETGRVVQQIGVSTYQVEIFPTIRAPVPALAQLEADRPVLLCRLASDGEMGLEFPAAGMARPSVNFVEAVDFWNDLALGKIDLSIPPYVPFKPPYEHSPSLDFSQAGNSILII